MPSARTCRDGQIHAEEEHVIFLPNATAVVARVIRGQLGQPHHKQASLREVCESHAAPVAKVSVVGGGHNGMAEPRQGAETAPVFPLVFVDGQGGITALDGDSSPQLPRHQPRALQCICSCRQKKREKLSKERES